MADVIAKVGDGLWNAVLMAWEVWWALGLLDDHTRHCVMGAEGEQRAERTEEMMAAVGRLMRRG